ncbi:MAG: hypothetical protein H5U40_01095 [Polyangiaceae bacterium]|nr:hypothetical protein [Polyangiaceae bacterium]
MRRARFEGSAPWLWVVALLLATLFLWLDPTRPRREERPRPPDEEPVFFELPPLSPPEGDAGVPSRRQR